jgi:hypothetical protein
MIGWLKQVVGKPLDFIKQTFSSSPSLQKSDLKNDLHANLANLAYKSHDDADREAQRFGYKVDRSLSNPNAITFTNDRGDAIISYRGTRPTNTDDLAAALHVVAGSRKHKRFDEAEDLARRVKAKYGDKVQATGHSLGGTQALHVNKKLGINAHAFNPGATIGDTVDSDNVRVVRHQDDLVSKALRVKRGSDVKIGGGTGASFSPLGFFNKVLRAHSIF